MAFGFARLVALATTWAIAVALPAVAQFETRASFPIGGDAGPYSLVVGDFNRDGILDVAEFGFSPAASVEILLGNGNGTFRLGATYPLAGSAFYNATASLRRNGILDLVIAGGNMDDVYVMLGNGDGTFQTPVPYPTTASPSMVGVGKFTRGGNTDLIALEWTSAGGVVCDCIEVLPGNDDGSFGAPITTPVPNIHGFAIATGDFNSDGKLDVAVAGGFGISSQVDILLGNGDGTFTADGYYAVGDTPQSIATGYFTQDKTKLDLAVANEAGSSLSVLLGNGDGTFQPSVYYDTPYPTWVIAEDLEGDGNVDLAASNAGLAGFLQEFPAGVSVFKGNGDGTFQAGAFYPAGRRSGGSYVAAGDFNGDHKPDLVDVNSDGQAIITLLNTGVVTFSPTTPLTFKAQAVGTTSSPQTVTLTNTGTAELKIQAMKASTGFSVTSTCGARVAPGAACTITATFSPTKQGVVQGMIAISDSASTKLQVIELLGNGS
ncbi:MAG: FG-GAP-like repeat-containing protein [Candidatus Sulfotelmatobacter sp.]